MNRLKGKTALVTGGAKGIGQAICREFAAQGARVIITDIEQDLGMELAESIRAQGGIAEFKIMDTSNEDEIAQVISSVTDTNVLVNNAGITGPDKPTHEIESTEWDRLMEINVRGVFLCTKYVIPLMKRLEGGSIINLSSIYGIVGAPDLPAYHASKGAVRLMTKTDALLYAPEGIRVNSIHPGFIWTPLVEDLAKSADQDVETFRKALDDRHPIGHVGEPEDIAHGAVYLASDESKFVTGTELVIDGGYTCQ